MKISGAPKLLGPPPKQAAIGSVYVSLKFTSRNVHDQLKYYMGGYNFFHKSPRNTKRAKAGPHATCYWAQCERLMCSHMKCPKAAIGSSAADNDCFNCSVLGVYNVV